MSINVTKPFDGHTWKGIITIKDSKQNKIRKVLNTFDLKVREVRNIFGSSKRDNKSKENTMEFMSNIIPNIHLIKSNKADVLLGNRYVLAIILNSILHKGENIENIYLSILIVM